MAVKIQVIFWVVTHCGVLIGYQCFNGPNSLHFHFTLKMEAAWTSEMVVSYHSTMWHHNPEDLAFFFRTVLFVSDLLKKHCNILCFLTCCNGVLLLIKQNTQVSECISIYQVPAHSLPLLAKLLEDRTNRLQGQLHHMHTQFINISDSNILQCLFEDIHWLVLIAGMCMHIYM